MSALRKKMINQVCPHCARKIKWAWIIRYESVRYVRLVYLCSQCERVIKTEEEKGKSAPDLSPGTLMMRFF